MSDVLWIAQLQRNINLEKKKHSVKEEASTMQRCHIQSIGLSNEIFETLALKMNLLKIVFYFFKKYLLLYFLCFNKNIAHSCNSMVHNYHDI